MRLYRRRRHEETAGIDLAPMLDFVLNLLIFFIVTAVFVKETGMHVNRPASDATASKSSDILAVAIDDAGNVYVDGREVDLRAVRANVERHHALKPEDGVVVIAHEAAASGLVVRVVDQIRQGGVQNVAFGTGRVSK